MIDIFQEMGNGGGGGGGGGEASNMNRAEANIS